MRNRTLPLGRQRAYHWPNCSKSAYAQSAAHTHGRFVQRQKAPKAKPQSKHKKMLGAQTTETGFTLHANTDPNTIVLTRTAEAVTANTTATYEFSGIDNPENTNTTFYARILTYASVDGTGAEIDAGGIAVSTAEQLTITAKVQETLTFCVGSTWTSNCSDISGNSFDLGDSNGVLVDTSTSYTNTGHFGIATNAQNGATVVMKGDTLKFGANDIDAIGGTAAAPSTVTTVEQFGMRVGVSGGSVTATAPYNTANYAFDTTATTAAGGDQIASSSSTTQLTHGTMTFLGKSADNSIAGIYTTTLTFIATGEF